MVWPFTALVIEIKGTSDCSLGNTSIATEAIPPRLAITIKDCTLCGGDLEIGTTNLDERVVRVEVFPESSALEGNLGAGLQLGQVNCRISRNGNAVEGNGSAGCHSC